MTGGNFAQNDVQTDLTNLHKSWEDFRCRRGLCGCPNDEMLRHATADFHALAKGVVDEPRWAPKKGAGSIRLSRVVSRTQTNRRLGAPRLLEKQGPGTLFWGT